MEGSTAISGITSALTTGLTTAANDVISSMGGVIPAALTILGAVMVIRWAIKTFKTAGASKA